MVDPLKCVNYENYLRSSPISCLPALQTDPIIAINVIVKLGNGKKKMSKQPWENYSGDPDPEFEHWKLKYEGINNASTTIYTPDNRSS